MKKQSPNDAMIEEREATTPELHLISHGRRRAERSGRVFKKALQKFGFSVSFLVTDLKRV